jgi:hypothetical protein
MIKVKDGYLIWKRKGFKMHITTKAHSLCGTRLTFGKSSSVKTADESEICYNCWRIARKRGLIEEVPEHIAAMPKGYRIMEVGETITSECKFWRNNKGPWQPFLGANEAYAIDGLVSSTHHPICCPVGDQKPAEVRDKPVQDPIKKQLHEYECRAKAAEDEVAELKHKLSKKERQLIQSQKSDERQHRKTVEATTLCNSYRSATNGHTLENIKTIMHSLKPEDLEGYRLNSPSCRQSGNTVISVSA